MTYVVGAVLDLGDPIPTALHILAALDTLPAPFAFDILGTFAVLLFADVFALGDHEGMQWGIARLGEMLGTLKACKFHDIGVFIRSEIRFGD